MIYGDSYGKVTSHYMSQIHVSRSFFQGLMRAPIFFLE